MAKHFQTIPGDPLSDVTRKERRVLLGVSTIGVVIVKSGLIPKELTTFGIKFEPPDQQALLFVLAAIVAYFLIAFVIYAATDFVSWRTSYYNARGSLDEEHDQAWQQQLEYKRSKGVNQDTGERAVEDEVRKQFSRQNEFFYAKFRLFRRSVRISFIRALFEFIVPIIVGLYALFLLFTASPPVRPQVHGHAPHARQTIVVTTTKTPMNFTAREV